jgi:hypothetical protein
MTQLFQYRYLLLVLLTACGASQVNMELNKKLETEHQAWLREHDIINKEHNELLAEFKKWDEEYAALKIEKDPIYDVQAELVKEHNQLLDEHSKFVEEHSKILNEHTETIKKHEQGTLKDPEFQQSHDEMLKRHKALVVKHKEMKRKHDVFEQEQVLVMREGRKKKAAAEAK